MLPPRTALLLTLLLAAGCPGLGARRPPQRPAPLSAVQPQAGFDAQQEQGHRAEATALKAAPQGAAMAVSTFQKLDGICWQVRQLYRDTDVPGRFLLRARGARGDVHVVVGETDYRSFAVLFLERARRLSVKLYVRSLPVDDAAVSKFEESVRAAGLSEDQILFFPKYGFCEAADQFHVLDEVKL